MSARCAERLVAEKEEKSRSILDPVRARSP
jgi:hypothetical protein